MKRLILTIAVALSALAGLSAQPRFHCGEDSAKALEILAATAAQESRQSRIATAARALAGIKTSDEALLDSTGRLEINLHRLSPLDFVSAVLAFSKACDNRNPGVQEFAEAFENIACRKGSDTGFASRLKYGADWAVDNIYRGNVGELTERMPDNVFKTKSLDHFTTHRDKYPAMTDSTTYEEVRMVEMGYRSHKIPHLKKQTITKKEIAETLREGDVIMLLSPESDYDLQDIGILVERDGVLHFIHASRQTGVVTEEPDPLPRFFKTQGQHFYGYRIIRPQ